MAKKKNGNRNRLKIQANRLIMLELKKRGIAYTNMDQATSDLAKSVGFSVGHLDSFSARMFLLAQFTGRKIDVGMVVAANPDRLPAPKKTNAPSESDIRDFYASWEWKRLALEIKLQRGRTCECCGAMAPQVRIVTDHVKPLRKYWHLRLDPTNMQVLCDDCNMGKGSHNETDFRALNDAVPSFPIEPELSPDEEMRLAAIRDQLRLN